MIYLDHAATTKPHAEVVSSMDPYLTEHYHNPSTQYAAGAAEGVTRAREQVAALLGADSDEIVFTGGGSEADNLALKGVFERAGGTHVVTSTIEHPAVLESCRWLESRGVEVTRLSPREDGRVDPEDVREAIRPETALVSIMHANNETGVIQPLEAIGEITREHGVLLHSDTVQAAGKLPIDVDELGLDLASLSAHKFYGPKGVGALYVREGIDLEPSIHGGGQEAGRRSGTENVPGIVGMGVAAELARKDLEERGSRLSELREAFVERVRESTDSELIGHPDRRLPGYALCCFAGYSGPDLVEGLADRGVAVSSGSACHSETPSPSSVLTEMGVDVETALGVVRVSMGRETTREDVERAADALEAVLEG